MNDSPLPRTRRSLVTAAVLFGMFASAIEMNIVSTAMPRIAGALGGSDRFAWVISIYLLTSTVAAPLSGKLADLYGRKPVYQLGMGLFLLGSALSGAAPSMNLLIAARAVQGIGAGALATVALTVLGDIYTPVERGRMQGLLSAVWGTAGALGPLAGGFIVDHLGWRWVFYLTVLPGAVAMAIMQGALHEQVKRRPASLDLAGAALLTAAIMALQFAGGEHGSSGNTGAVVAAVAGVVLLVLFAVVERRAAEPILPLSLLSDRLIGTVLLSALLSGAVMFGLSNYVPLFVQGVEGATARAAGAMMTPFSVAWPLASIVAGLSIGKVDTRVSVRTGMTLVAAGSAMALLAAPGDSRAVLLVAVTFVGTGMGLTSTPLLIALQSAVSWETRGIATAAFSFCRTLGGTLGMVLAGAIHLNRLDERGVMASTVDALLRPGAPAGEPAVRDALAYAVHGALVSVAALGLLAWVASLAFPRAAVRLEGVAPVAHE
jgi:EmrB/QacA subfamily drug resistance transporter